MSICLPLANSICSLREPDICPLCGQSGGSAAGPERPFHRKELKKHGSRFQVSILFPLFCSAILEQRSRQRPQTRPFVLDETDQETVDFIIVLLSMCFCPIRATKWHISSKVSVAELCISSGRKPTYRARHSLAYRQKLIAGTKINIPV